MNLITKQLMNSAERVLGTLDNGMLFSGKADHQDEVAKLFGELLKSVESARDKSAWAARTSSPFRYYRADILAPSTAGYLLRLLVANLARGSAYPLRLDLLFAADMPAHVQRIAIGLLEHHAQHGSNDKHFRELSTEILSNWVNKEQMQ